VVILDSNVLLYVHIEGFPQHKKAKAWLAQAISNGTETIGIPWQVAASFLRISTNTRVFKQPFDLGFAKQCLDDLFSHPLIHAVVPTNDHWKHYSRILFELNLTGDIVMDAHIVAIAVEHRAAVASTDKDFRRFSDYVKIIDPLEK